MLLHLTHAFQILEIIGVLHSQPIFRLSEIRQNECPPVFRLLILPGSFAKQIEVVVHIHAVDIVGVSVQQIVEFHLSGIHILEFVFQNQAHIVQTLLNHIVRRLDLFFGDRDLLEIIFLEMRVIGALNRVALLLRECGIGRGCTRSNGIGRLRSVVGIVERERVFVASSPVVFQFTIAPLLLEGCFTGIFSGRVVEIPRVIVIEREGFGRILIVGGIATLCILLRQIFLTRSIFRLLLFFFLQFVNNFLNHLFSLVERHFRKAQQRILKRHISGIHSEFVEHIAPLFQFAIVGIGFINQRNGLRIARLSQVVFMLIEIDSAQCQLANRLIDAISRALFTGKDIILDSARRVVDTHIEVADGIVHLVEVFLIAVVARHVLQRAHFRFNVSALKHCALLDACIEFGAIGRAAVTAGALKCLVSQLLFARRLIELSQQEIEPHLLCAAGALNCLRQIGDGLCMLIRFDIEIGECQIGKRAYASIGDLVDMHVREHIVGFGGPLHRAITERFPNLAFQHQLGFPREMACNVVESGGRSQEIALHIFRFCQHIPRIVDKGVVFLPLEVFFIFLVVGFARFFGGFLFDRVQCNSLLHLFDGAVETARWLRRFGEIACFGRVDEKVLCVVVLIVVFQHFNLLFVVGHPIVVHIVARGEGLPKARHRRVLLRAAPTEKNHHKTYQ